MLFNNKIYQTCIAAVIAVMFTACSLDIEETDSVILDEEQGIFAGVEDPVGNLRDLANTIRSNHEGQDNYYALTEVATDELLIPTRGTDWGDNGIWRTLHAHTWSANHQYVLNVWNQFNQNIFNATEIIDDRSAAPDSVVAQAKFLRAWSTFIIMDLYGKVPFRQPDEGADVDPVVMSRTDAYTMAIDDLNDALTLGVDAANNNGATVASVNYLLAKLKLNAHIYDGSGTPSSENMNAVIGHVDAIAAEGHALEEGYFDLFTDAADAETIWYVTASAGNRMWNGLHYNQVTPDNGGGGWNGFSTLAEFYDTFEGPSDNNSADAGQEERRGFVPNGSNSDTTNYGIGFGFLIGQQWTYNEADGASPLNDRANNPLVFTREFPGLVGNNERTGIRVIKYHPANGAFAGHVIMFRYSDAHLMKAEAKLRLGDSGGALADVNELRALRGASNLTGLDEASLLEERGRELYIEMWRRNDMIRFGQFTRAWEFKDAAAVDDVNRNLYPIPTDAILSNPNLEQNPGY